MRHHKLLTITVLAFLAFGVYIFTRYRLYATAIIWHGTHRDLTKINGYQARLPNLWWEGSSDEYKTFVLRRATPTNTFPFPEILIRPALSGTTHKSDRETLESVQALVAAKQMHPALGSSSYLLILKASDFLLYCEKTDTKLLGTDLSNRLSCMAADVPFIFTYDGPPNYEEEAESILKSLK